MERLTERYIPGVEPSGGKILVMSVDDFDSLPLLAKVYESLAAYEDIGMSPKEIIEFVERWKFAVELAGLCKQEDVDHLKELLQSEKDGRLKVFPCNVGDTMWFIRPHENEIVETVVEKMVVKGNGLYMKLSCNKMYETSCNSIGKTVFFTHDEAKAALKGSME